MEIYIIRQNQETGPYSAEAARTLLEQGEVEAGDFAWHDGLPDWIPLSDVIAPVSVEQPAEQAAPLTANAEPATQKQKALLSFLGVALSPELTREQAALLVNDAMEDPQKAGRLTQWNEERIRLYPDLFAAELQAKKENRATHFLELCHSAGAEYFSGVTKAHCQVLVGFLDVKFPHWDARESDAAEHYFFPAVAEKFPQLMNKAWRGRLQYADSPKPANRSTRRSSTSKLSRTGTSPLVATTRGVLLGLVILAGLYLAHRSLQHTTTASPLGETLAEPPRPTPPPAAPTPLAAPPAPAADLPVIEPLPLIATQETPPAPSASVRPDLGVIPAPMSAAPAAPMAAPEPVPPMAAAASPMAPAGPLAPMAPDSTAVATAPMAALPATEPPQPALPPGLPPEAAAIPPLSLGEMAPAATTISAAKTSLLLTKPVEAQLAYGKVTLPTGTPVKLLDRQGAALTVKYGNSVLTIAASSTDVE